MTKTQAQWARRGAIIGAASLGLAGFLTGISLCIFLELPIPPLFITEICIIVGGALGALVGLTSIERQGRNAWLGLLLGSLLGVLLFTLKLHLALLCALAGAALGWNFGTEDKTREWVDL